MTLWEQLANSTIDLQCDQFIVHKKNSFSYKSLPSEPFTSYSQSEVLHWRKCSGLPWFLFPECFLCLADCSRTPQSSPARWALGLLLPWFDQASFLGSGRTWTQIFQKVSDLQMSLILKKKSPELLSNNTQVTPVGLEWGWEAGSLKGSKWFLLSWRPGKPIAKFKRPSMELSISFQHVKNRKSISWEFYTLMTCQSLLVFFSETQTHF